MSNAAGSQTNSYAGINVDGYILENEIKRDGFWISYKAYNPETESYAICRIIGMEHLNDDWELKLRKLINKLDGISQVLQYKNFIKMDIEGTFYVFILSQYMDGIALRDYIQDNPIKITIPFINQFIINILTIFHAIQSSKLISHGNLNENNILIVHDLRSLTPEVPILRISDFGLGEMCINFNQKDDYRQLALMCQSLLETIEPTVLDGLDRYFYHKLIQDFIPKKLLELDPLVEGEYVQNPGRLIDLLNQIEKEYYDSFKSSQSPKLNDPFDFLRCESLGDSFELSQLLFTDNFPGYSDLFRKNNTILTGPRGCGKTTIFRNLSLKAKILGKKVNNIDDYKESFIGIYYHCNDLYFAFPYLKDHLEDEDREGIIHYFNLSILYEILDLLSISRDVKGFELHKDVIPKIHEFLSRYLSNYELPLSGIDSIRHIMALVLIEKVNIRNWLRNKNGQKPNLLTMDFISNFCLFLRANINWMAMYSIYLFLDDYSMPNISKQLQEVLNDFIFFPMGDSDIFFKVSTENIVTFYPISSRGKVLEEGREFIVVDIGQMFLEYEEGAAEFLLTVINKRLQNSKKLQNSKGPQNSKVISEENKTIEEILGSFKMSSNELAKAIRKRKATYHGYDIIIQLCSGDIAHVLDLTKRIFELGGGYEKLMTSKSILPISKRLQNKAIKDAGSDFLENIEYIPKIGNRLKRTTIAFGNVAHSYLINRHSKNEGQKPPWQAYRIEVRDELRLTSDSQDIYENLLRYSIFIRDLRGKSIRGGVAPRLYMRKLLIPFFGLTLSKRDNIGLNGDEFITLLTDPEKFENSKKEANERYTNKRQRERKRAYYRKRSKGVDDKQMRIP